MSIHAFPTKKAHRWRCPSCADDVPALLPNGWQNRHPLSLEQCALNHPTIQQDLQNTDRSQNIICLSCRDAYRELLGSLVLSETQNGDTFAQAGIANTGIIGALFPLPEKETQLSIYRLVDNQLQIVERCLLSDFNPQRITYPDSQGDIPALIWSLYQAQIQRLRAEIER